MAENVLTVLFDVESEAFQAATELKNAPAAEGYTISQLALVKKQDGKVAPVDGFDTGAKTADDTLDGMLIGSLVGILGGPLGVLLGGSYGALLGSTIDATDAVQGASMIEMVCSKMEDGDVCLVALAQEENEAALDEKLSKFKTTIVRHEAAVVAVEVEEAAKVQAELSRQARQQMRQDKKDEFNQMVSDKREEIKSGFESFKAKLKKEG